jgi:hypothetical protein
MGNNLTQEEERVNEKILAIQNQERVKLIKQQLWEKFINDYSKFYANEIHENQDVIRSTLLKNWKFNQ